MDLLDDPIIKAALAQAWRDSTPESPKARHEEGGYIVQNADGTTMVILWPAGEGSAILPPMMRPEGWYNGFRVLATFHTHPNPPMDEVGQEWEQGPGIADQRWHSRRKMRGFVIAQDHVYEIGADGSVQVIGKRKEVLSS